MKALQSIECWCSAKRRGNEWHGVVRCKATWTSSETTYHEWTLPYGYPSRVEALAYVVGNVHRIETNLGVKPELHLPEIIR